MARHSVIIATIGVAYIIDGAVGGIPIGKATMPFAVIASAFWFFDVGIFQRFVIAFVVGIGVSHLSALPFGTHIVGLVILAIATEFLKSALSDIRSFGIRIIGTAVLSLLFLAVLFVSRLFSGI